MSRPGKDEDSALQQYLGRGSPLSDLYRRASREEPGPAVDRAVREAARDAVRPPARRPAGPFSATWLMPAALAAVLVLSVSVVVLLPPSGQVSGPAPAGSTQPSAPADEKVQPQAVHPRLRQEPAPSILRDQRREKKALSREPQGVPELEQAAPAGAPLPRAAAPLARESAEAGRAPSLEEVPTQDAETDLQRTLARIRALYQAGQEQQALAELERLAARHPELDAQAFWRRLSRAADSSSVLTP